MKIGLGTALFCVFLTLRLCNVIAWSWWWVTAPIWIPLVIAGVLFALVAIVSALDKK